MPVVTFFPFEKKVEVPEKSNLMKVILNASLPIGSSCGGVGVCTMCLVKVLKNPENLSTPNTVEKKLMIREKLSHDLRVSCQAKVLGPVSVTASYW